MNKYFSKSTFITILWVTFFGIGFGMVEAAVVIYMRTLYFPEGFSFPINAIADPIVFTELWREAATVLMLAAVGILAGKNKVQRFAYFLISFAVWDIFYYVFLKVLIDWPESLMTWDILFLLPVAWIGPVIAPIILSILMIGIALMLIAKNTPLNWKEWALYIGGAFISILSFTLDFVTYLRDNEGNTELYKKVGALSLTYVPQDFDWWIFLIAIACILTGMCSYYLRTNSRTRRLQGMQFF
ncbi:MAG: hypothetical protein COA58_13010 [Bacteroidetes bacterium]|nr:MAG: hypothetical protein COA58_13010 [Bacteroidota bacterium]